MVFGGNKLFRKFHKSLYLTEQIEINALKDFLQNFNTDRSIFVLNMG